jgi:hypothetical protein
MEELDHPPRLFLKVVDDRLIMRDRQRLVPMRGEQAFTNSEEGPR